MYAVIEDSGTQIRVAKGDVVDIDLRDIRSNAKHVSFDRVLIISEGEGKAKIGSPYVSGAKVTAEIVGEVDGDKLRINKYSRRKGYRRHHSHVQTYLRVKIDSISG